MPGEIPYITMDDISRQYAQAFSPIVAGLRLRQQRQQQLQDAERERQQHLQDMAMLRQNQLADQATAEQREIARDYRQHDLARATAEEDRQARLEDYMTEQDFHALLTKQEKDYEASLKTKAQQEEDLKKARTDAVEAGVDVKPNMTVGDLTAAVEDQHGKNLEAAMSDQGRLLGQYARATGIDLPARVKEVTDLALQNVDVKSKVPKEDQVKLANGAPIQNVLNDLERRNPGAWQVLHDAVFEAGQQLLSRDAVTYQSKDYIVQMNSQLKESSQNVNDLMKKVHKPQSFLNAYAARVKAEQSAMQQQTSGGPSSTHPLPDQGQPSPRVTPGGSGSVNPLSPTPTVPSPEIPAPISQPQVNFMGQPVSQTGPALFGAPASRYPVTLSNPFAPLGQYLMGGTTADRAREAAMIRQQQKNQATNALFFPTSTGTIPVIQ